MHIPPLRTAAPPSGQRARRMPVSARPDCYRPTRLRSATETRTPREALFWFHPLEWCLRVRLVEKRERASDKDVLLTGSAPQKPTGILKKCELHLRITFGGCCPG